MKDSTVRSLTVTAMCTAIICVLAPVSIPLGTLVPISLATFAIYLVSSLLEPKYACIAVGLYILLGAVGVPVFSGWTGGISKLVGVTGGYIIGYLPLAFIVSIMHNSFKAKWVLPLSMALGTVVLYALGTIWFMYQTKNPIGSALASCVIPFLPGDAAKIASATAVSVLVSKRVKLFQN